MLLLSILRMHYFPIKKIITIVKLIRTLNKLHARVYIH